MTGVLADKRNMHVLTIGLNLEQGCIHSSRDDFIVKITNIFTPEKVLLKTLYNDNSGNFQTSLHMSLINLNNFTQTAIFSLILLQFVFVLELLSSKDDKMSVSNQTFRMVNTRRPFVKFPSVNSMCK